MKQMNFGGKITILVGLLTMCILGGAVFFATLSESDNIEYGLDEEDTLRLKEIEVRSRLRDFDKVNDAIVMVQGTDDGISRVDIFVSMEETMNDSERNDLSDAVSQYFEDAEIEIKYAEIVK